MTFLAADQGAAPSGGAAAPVIEPDPAAAAATADAGPVDYKALLLQLLDLDPAADDAAIQAAFIIEQNEPEDDPAATQATTDLQAQLTGAQARIAELETAAQKSQQEEIDELIAEAGELPDDAKNALRTALSTDRAGGMALLGQMKKPAAPAPVIAAEPAAAVEPAAAPAEGAAPAGDKTKTKEVPPSPQHNPKKTDADATDKEMADKISARAREIVKKSNPKIPLTKAYQQAEKELKNAA